MLILHFVFQKWFSEDFEWQTMWMCFLCILHFQQSKFSLDAIPHLTTDASAWSEMRLTWVMIYPTCRHGAADVGYAGNHKVHILLSYCEVHVHSIKRSNELFLCTLTWVLVKGTEESNERKSSEQGWGSPHASLPGSYHDTAENGAWHDSVLTRALQHVEHELHELADHRVFSCWFQVWTGDSESTFDGSDTGLSIKWPALRMSTSIANKAVFAFRRDTPFRVALTSDEDVLNKGSPLTERIVCNNGRGVSTKRCHSNGAGRPTQRGAWCELTGEYESE